jgi:hypothetical protein
MIKKVVGAPMPGSKFGESELPGLPGEPEGWRELQERARNARDPKQLDAIIADMNRLLSECEKKAPRREGPYAGFPPGSGKQNSTTK